MAKFVRSSNRASHVPRNPPDSLLRRGCFVALFLAMTMEGGSAGSRPSGSLVPTRSEVIATQGMAATSHPLVSQVALDVLKRGGTAVDAAIAANATMGLMEPTGNGVGGDLFAIVWDAKSQKLFGLNGSGRSPKSLTLEKLRAELKKLNSPTIPRTGPLPVSVPGAVDGWFELHGKFGKLPMKELLAPAISYARNGFPVTEIIAEGWARNARNLQKYPGFAETYMPNGRAPAKGEVFRNPLLANTLAAISEGGRDAFYKGDIAKRVESYMRANGGYLTAADLAAHKSEWVEPVSTNYRGYDVWELPPNTQGVAALQMLNILEAFDLKVAGFRQRGLPPLVRRGEETGLRRPRAFLRGSVIRETSAHGGVVKGVRGEAARADRPKHGGARISGRRQGAGTGRYHLPDCCRHGRQHGVADPEQLSRYRLGRDCPTGSVSCLQDRGELFSLEPTATRTSTRRGKRPFHTIIPAFVTKDGKPLLSFGVMGGEHAAAGPRADPREPHRLRHEPAGSRRCAARAARWFE